MYPGVIVTDSLDTVLNDPKVDGVLIATPVFSHAKLAKEVLKKGKHVLIEKPMTGSTQDAKELIALGEEVGKTVMVDHTFLYTGAVQKMKEVVDSGEIGQIKYFDSTRINLGLLQSDVNVIWDLAPHDISICSFLLGEKPKAVSATGISHTNNGIENIAYLTLFYESDLIAHFNCSWTSPVKLRNVLVGGDKKMILYNDLEATEKVKIYDTGFEVKEMSRQNLRVDYRVGDVYIPKLEPKEALSGVITDFVAASTTGIEPLSNFKLGLEVVEVLEAAQKSIKNNGTMVEI
jgi:predicted dehydrogenase